MASTASEREFEFSDRDFDRIRRFVTEQTGIMLPDAKKGMVYGRLSRRIREFYHGNFTAFCNTVEDGDLHEQDFLINAITTNLTAFYRERHHFDYLGETLIPRLLEQNQASKRLRIWSAGCSTGEEPYSIAMQLHASIRGISNWDIRILATDLDGNSLDKAAHGVYEIGRTKNLSDSELRQHFVKGRGQMEGQVRVRDHLKQMIVFKRLNLLHEWPMRGPFDLIFCRNVVIYFDKDTQRMLFDRYADILRPDGHLFIGHSETLYKVCDRFEGLGKTIYRRRV